MKGRWAINIDIEGFSRNYEHNEERKTFAILALSELMDSIIKIGTLCYPGDPEKNYSDRLFSHQFGDGFLICSDFPEPDASRAISLAVAIMRHLMMNGYSTKAAISTGDMSDIKGCYPKSVRDAKDERVHLGMGLMTVISVMGTALTKAHKLANTREGTVLIVDKDLIVLGIPEGVQMKADSEHCIDWISSKIPMAEEISRAARLEIGSTEALMEKFNEYCAKEPVPPAFWVDATYKTLAYGNE